MSKKKLVIVESPNKIKKIGGFLGPDYIVKASYGHIQDLDKKNLSIDVENNFKPNYVVNPDKTNVISELKREMRKCDTCYLASDFDREGESIAWHISNVLKLKPENRQRILFTEITKKAILDSLKKPGDIDMNMFYSQQARRILDRLIGYKITPVLWNQIQNSMKKNSSLSAGRVQSVVVKMIIEREEEIKKFSESMYFKTLGNFQNSNDIDFKCDLSEDFDSQEKSYDFLESCKTAIFKVNNVTTKKTTRSPSAPFITSTLQQEASNKYKMNPKSTMKYAQQLYESGYITYMRTDSVTLSLEAQEMAKAYILEKFGDKYLNLKQYKNKNSNSQEAHEAIRPCNIKIDTLDGDDTIDSYGKKLYKLIWKRTVASQMASAKINIITSNIEISNRKEYFISKYEKVIFDGFQRVYKQYQEENDSDEDNNFEIKLKEGDILKRKTIHITEKYTKPSSSRFTEASLVKELDKKGIGRPSTYSNMISIIQDRKYANKMDINGGKKECLKLELKLNDEINETKNLVTLNNEKQKLVPTEIGLIVNKFLNNNFPELMDYTFTAKIEKELDEIAQGKKEWYIVVKSVYNSFNPKIMKLLKNTETEKSKYNRVVGTDPNTKCNVIAYIGKYGPVVKLELSELELKDKFAPVTNHDIKNITLEEALVLLRYPYIFDQYNGKDIEINKGKFGLYFKYNGNNYSLNEINENDLSNADVFNLEFIKNKINNKTSGTNNLIKKINDKIEIKNGKYGAYICYKNKLNIKIYGKKQPSDYTEEDCIILINKKKKDMNNKKTK